MTEIIKVQQPEENNKPVSSSYQGIIENRQNQPCVMDILHKDLNNILVDLVLTAFFENGNREVTVEDTGAIVKTLLEDIRSDFFDYTVNDIKLSFKKGIRGEFGDFAGINIKTLYGFLKQYREKVLVRLPQYQQPKEVEITQEEIEKRKILAKIGVLEDFIADFDRCLGDENLDPEEVFSLMGVYYDVLTELNFISIDSSKKNEYMERAKKVKKNGNSMQGLVMARLTRTGGGISIITSRAKNLVVQDWIKENLNYSTRDRLFEALQKLKNTSGK